MVFVAVALGDGVGMGTVRNPPWEGVPRLAIPSWVWGRSFLTPAPVQAICGLCSLHIGVSEGPADPVLWF